MKVYAFTKWRAIICTVIIVAVCAVCAMNFSTIKEVVSAAAPKRDLPIYCVKRDDNKVSLTFDAAWDE